MSTKDQVFAERFSDIRSFSFDEKVVAVFPDMIRRSVPGYDTILKGIAMYAMKYIEKNSVVYDLGASLGAVSLTIDQAVGDQGLTIHAIDNSPAMVRELKHLLLQQQLNNQISIHGQDLIQFPMANASMVVSNFTLQFIEPGLRDQIVVRIYQSLNIGGAFVLSEKVASSPQLIDDYHGYKKINGYSDVEIAQKRQALEDTLLPDSVATWKSRLNQAGFRTIELWFRAFNFISLIAVK